MSNGSGTPSGTLQQRIIGFLTDLAWTKEILADDVVRTKYDGFFGEVKILIHTHASGIMMAINPVIPKPERGWGQSVMRLLQTLSGEVHLIKVGVDKEGDIYLRVDLPQEELTFEQFSFVLFNICQVCEQLQVPILQANVYDNMANSA